jgi:prephenate dehydrogenase
MTSPTDSGSRRRAAVVGTGLIGGSIGMALRRAGWRVTGSDHDESRALRALEVGAIDTVGTDRDAEITFIATPVGVVADMARHALDNSTGVVTDVGGVKTRIVDTVANPRFIGGHPMAGSEQEGLDGADPDLFAGATWVLTPTETTDPAGYAAVHAVVSSLGADVIALHPARHDALVAVVSHVPHLTAAALMSLAAAEAEQHTTLLRLAAGGFRDMTRVAAGHPGIWPDICVDNADAIVGVLADLVGALDSLRTAVAGEDRAALLDVLERARVARRNLPGRVVARAEELVEFRIPVPDRVGVIAEVTTLCSELGCNIYDIETVHSSESDRGVLVITVDPAERDLLRGALLARGYRPAVQGLAGA